MGIDGEYGNPGLVKMVNKLSELNISVYIYYIMFI